MYPETDSPPFKVTKKLRDEISKIIIEKPSERIKRLTKDFGLSNVLAKNLYLHPRFELFEKICGKYDLDPKLVANTIIDKITYLRRQGVNVDNLDDKTLSDIFQKVANKEVSKEAIDIILVKKGKNPSKSVSELINICNLFLFSEDELLNLIDVIIQERKSFIEEIGIKSIGPIISEVMERSNGRADGATVALIVKEKVTSMIKN